MKFYFDYLSPYSYIAAQVLPPLAARYGRELEWVPVLFAGLLKASGRKGPAEIASFKAWLVRDVLRKCHKLGIPIQAPVSHPFNPLLLLRLTLLELDDSVRQQLCMRLFAAVWKDKIDVTDIDKVRALLDDLGLDAESCLQQARQSAVKQRLMDNTQHAVTQQVFGVPTIVVDGQLFWGYDDFANLELFLIGDDRYDEQVCQQWLAVSPSATR